MGATSSSSKVGPADFYRAGDGNDERFTAKMIVSDDDIAPDFPGANLWVQRRVRHGGDGLQHVTSGVEPVI